MNRERLLKRLAAIALSVSFFLPLAQCSVVKPGEPSVLVTQTLTAYGAYEWPSPGSTLALALFFWPLLLQIWTMIRPDRTWGLLPRLAEVALSLCTACGIAWLVVWSSAIRYGALVAWSAVAIYAVTALRQGLRSRDQQALG